MSTVADLPRNMRAKIQIDRSSSCWRWTGAQNSQGYGCVGVLGKSRLVHRVAYELLVGPIPAGLVIDHVVKRGCVHKTCLNPAHLEPVTNLENIRRGINPNKTHCPAGHEYAGDNLILRTRENGRINRNCRTCSNQFRNERYKTRVVPVLADDDPKHGTTTGYTYYECRCEPCRDANRERLRIWRESKSA